MKQFLFVCLCVAFALAVPNWEQDQERYEQEQNQERYQRTGSQYERKDNQNEGREEQYERGAEQSERDEDQPLRYTSYGSLSTSVDLLAKELNYLSSKYGGQGVLKVSYSPPLVQRADDSVAHDLGYLNLKYFPPYVYKAVSGKAPLLYVKHNRNHAHKHLVQAIDVPDFGFHLRQANEDDEDRDEQKKR